MELIVFHDQPSIFCLVGFQKGVMVLAVSFGLGCGQLGIAQTLSSVDQVAEMTYKTRITRCPSPHRVGTVGAARLWDSPEQPLHQWQGLDAQ